LVVVGTNDICPIRAIIPSVLGFQLHNREKPQRSDIKR